MKGKTTAKEKRRLSREARTSAVKELMLEIASRGRKFFRSKDDRVAELVDKGRIYYKAEWGKKDLLCLDIPKYRQPKGWFHGGTLMALVKEFRDFIRSGEPVEYSQLHSPHWGYPEEDMEAIRSLAYTLGILKEGR